MPRITVITPTHNRKAVLLRAIASVRAQSLADYEHVIVDDGSTDGTAEAVASVGDPRIRYVALPGWRGANTARNLGFAEARSDLITFLDSDDVYRPERLERTVALFRSRPEIDLAISSFETVKHGTIRPSLNAGGFLDGDALERALASYAIFIAGSAITARLGAIVAAGAFDENLFRMQDRDFLLRMSRLGGALMLGAPDWTKNESADSISGNPQGYIESFGEMAARHPRLKQLYPDLTSYVVARQVLSSVLKGLPGKAWREYRANRNNPALGYSAPALLRGYVAGKKQRKRISAEIRAICAAETGPREARPAPAGVTPDAI